MTTRKTKPSKAATRAALFSLRLDPKLKYLAEIGARLQRRSLARYLEWSLQESLARQPLGKSTVWDEGERLWAPSPALRFMSLATRHPELLDYDEQTVFQFVRTHLVERDFKGAVVSELFYIDKKRVQAALVEALWEPLQAYGIGQLKEEELLKIANGMSS